MSLFHCSCGFGIDDADEFGDHLRAVFERPGDLGTDGRMHTELVTDASSPPGIEAGDRPRHVCACGFGTDDTAEFDDHALLVLIPPDSIGNDGNRHIPVNTSTPDRWYIGGTSSE